MENKKKVVVALGHKALGKTLPEQKVATLYAAKVISDLVEEGCQVVITHSNAPQVGMIHTAMKEFGNTHEEYTIAPMSVCSAMSQGYIGYDLQNAIRSELIRRGIFKTVTTLLTQVKVDPYDDAFYHPVKLVGDYLTKEEAEAEEKKGNYVTLVENGMYKKTVASPKPQEIIEIDAVKALLDVGQVVIAGGGGGIPVMEQGSNLKGASAVIEKDLTSGLIARNIEADYFIILTSVEHASLFYGTEKETPIENIPSQTARQYIAEGHFSEDSMLPKIKASVEYVESQPNGKAIITSLDKAKQGLAEKTGTIITL